MDQDSDFFNQSRQILDYSESQLVTTSKNLIELFAVITRASGYNLETTLALEILEAVIQNFEIIYPSQDSLAMFLELTKRYQPFGLKVHDFEIISIGLAAGIHNFATFNTKDFKAVKEVALYDL